MKNVHVKEVELKGKEWETILDNAFKKRVKGQTIDGFRKGKAVRGAKEYLASFKGEPRCVAYRRGKRRYKQRKYRK